MRNGSGIRRKKGMALLALPLKKRIPHVQYRMTFFQ
jgi:hypothetical protein